MLFPKHCRKLLTTRRSQTDTLSIDRLSHCRSGSPTETWTLRPSTRTTTGHPRSVTTPMRHGSRLARIALPGRRASPSTRRRKHAHARRPRPPEETQTRSRQAAGSAVSAPRWPRRFFLVLPTPTCPRPPFAQIKLAPITAITIRSGPMVADRFAWSWDRVVITAPHGVMSGTGLAVRAGVTALVGP